MSPGDEDWKRVNELLADALERPPVEREAFLCDACGGDDALRGQVEALIGLDDRAAAFMGTLIDRVPEASTDGQAALGPKRRSIGRYELRRVIATGGMGTVYEGVQEHPKRPVALKVLRHGVTSPQAMKRFDHEAEILGRLHHPNIAQIHEAGTFDEGEGAQPYFAMELIRGRPLIEHCDSLALETKDRLALFVKICDAVQYAHHQGVVHRDLKPDNVLMDEQGEPKILDFGVARSTDSDIRSTTVQTDIGQLIGTLPYMSPEQVSGDPRQIDTRSDVYSLGVVLYELVCGSL